MAGPRMAGPRKAIGTARGGVDLSRQVAFCSPSPMPPPRKRAAFAHGTPPSNRNNGVIPSPSDDSSFSNFDPECLSPSVASLASCSSDVSQDLQEENLYLAQASLNPLLPTMEQQRNSDMMAAKQRAESRREGVQALYGHMEDPSTEAGGYVREFYEWCRAGPDEYVRGMKTCLDKTVYQCLSGKSSVFMFMSYHFLQRPLRDKKTLKYTVHEKKNGKWAVANCIKALKALYDYQKAHWAEGPDAYVKLCGPRPNDEGELTGLKKTHGLRRAEDRQKKHLPRGKAAITMEGYTRDQNQQLFDYGLTNETIRQRPGNVSSEKVRWLHTHHAFAHNCVLRFDDRQQILLSQCCTQDPPTRFEQASKLLCIVLDWRKTNFDGSFESVYAMRHRTDPKRCTWFAFALELYCQVHLMGLILCLADFIPYYSEEDKSWRHPWYDRYLFIGNNRARKNVPSSPNPYKQCTYHTVLQAFTWFYGIIKPAVSGYHKLHLQRGAVARMADADNIVHNDIAKAGGWKRDGAMYVSYLTALPIRFVEWLCGYGKSKDDDNVCPRNAVEPPEELWSQVFPWVVPVREQLAWECAEVAAKRLSLSECKLYGKTDDTLIGFLECCEYGAKYFLQDCAMMYDSMSDHEIYSTPLLCSSQFMDFRSELLGKMMQNAEKKIEEEQLKKTSLIDTFLMFSYLKKIYNLLAPDVACLGELPEDNLPPSVDATTQALSKAAEIAEHVMVAENASRAVFADHGGMDPNLHCDPELLNSHGPVVVFQGCDVKDPSTWPELPVSWARNKIIFHRISSVEVLVKEYLVGHPGPPALRDLERKYNRKGVPSWRKGNKAKRKAICQRKGIYDFIDQDPDSAVDRIKTILGEAFPSALAELGRTVDNPGEFLINKLIKYFQGNREGAEKRCAMAMKRKKKKRKGELESPSVAAVADDGAVGI